MGDRYLTDLADVCRRSGPVIEVDGWQHRGRSSGGYSSGAPNHVMWHHTASNPSSDGWDDVNYMTFHADAAPLANLYLSRDGTVYVCAGGATNTNGSGSDPCGHLADDTMNTNAIGIEAANTGVGERWADVQLDRYVRLVADLNDAYGIPVERSHGHAEYAPDRKIDPAGPDRYADGAETWDMDYPRMDVAAAHTPKPPDPIPTPEGLIEMYLLGVLGPNSDPAAPSPTVIRVGASTVTWEADAVAQGLDEWFGVPYKQAGDNDASHLLVSRTATNGLPDSVRDPNSPYYCPALAGAWH